MTEHSLDDEVLAAFLDGTLAPTERARVMRVIADRPEEFARFVEATEILAEVNEEESVGVIAIVLRVLRRWKGKLLLAVPLVAVARLAGLVVLSSSAKLPDAIEIIHGAPGACFKRAGVLSARLGAQWDDPRWSVTRGGGASELSPGTAARIGARVAQLEHAAKARDSLAYGQAEERLLLAVAQVGGVSSLIARKQVVPIGDARARLRLAQQLRESLG